MLFLRISISLVIFSLTIVMAVRGVLEWPVFEFWLAAFTLYLFAYFIWPSYKRTGRFEGGIVVDILELIIEFPYQIFRFTLKSIWFVFVVVISNDDDCDIL